MSLWSAISLELESNRVRSLLLFFYTDGSFEKEVRKERTMWLRRRFYQTD